MDGQMMLTHYLVFHIFHIRLQISNGYATLPMHSLSLSHTYTHILKTNSKCIPRNKFLSQGTVKISLYDRNEIKNYATCCHVTCIICTIWGWGVGTLLPQRALHMHNKHCLISFIATLMFLHHEWLPHHKVQSIAKFHHMLYHFHNLAYAKLQGIFNLTLQNE